MKAYALLLVSLFFAACTEPRVCGQCDDGERACFDTRAEAELACPSGFTPDSDSGSIDGSNQMDGDSPDAGNDIGVDEDARSPDATNDASRPDAHPGDQGTEDAETPDAAHTDATPVDGGMADGTPDDLGAPDAELPPDAEVPDAANPCPNPEPEVCNGRDDDCDGQIDEDFAEVLSFPCSVGIGACVRVGIGICDPEGGTTCSVTPHPAAPEICDNVDNDCDGMVDEDNPGAGEACDSGLLGMCGEGRTSCEGGELVCNAQHEPSEETCNDGRDNDCDGDTDEDCLCIPLQAYPCYQGPAGTAGVGQCEEGTATCDALGMSLGECNGEIRPTQEVCNGLDDDCDGVIDDVLGVNDQCSLGNGICRAQGRWECGDEGLVCNAEPTPPAEEVCNGLDDDCDGVVDNAQGVGEVCHRGVGACERPGVIQCSPDGPVCNAQPGQPAPNEPCNGLDDDCDGSIDEGCPGAPPRQILIDYPGEQRFLLDEREITTGAFRFCHAQENCQAGEDLPIVNITVDEARRHCQTRGGRLPTRDEWLLAAYGPGTRTYPWGNAPAPSCARAVMNDPQAGGSGCGNNGPMPACSRQLGNTPEGVCDLFGNVWEIVEDCSDFTDDCAIFGGSFANVGADLSDRMNRFEIGSANRFVGFRCAYDLPE